VALREEAAQVLARIGLHLSGEKTLITHIDEGLDFLGWRIQRHRKRGTNQHYIYTYPSRKALRAVMAKVKMWCRQVDTNQPLDVLLARVNPLLKGSLGVLELLHDMVFERFTERFCNTSATRGACCRRCSEPC
jgi:RNA-directed DNA polymerase